MKATYEWTQISGARFSAGFERGYAQLRGYTAEYREWGQGSPLVIVPGLAGGVELMGPLAQLLGEHFRVISYQLRGEDDCFALRGCFDLNDLAEDLAEFLDWHGLETPAILGVSFGGVVALELAARFPHRIGALSLQGVGTGLEPGLLQRVASVVLSRYPLPANNPFVNQFFNLLFGNRQKPGPLFDFVTRQCWQTDQGVMAHRFRLVERLDVRPQLARIRVPTLAISGDRDLFVSARSLTRLAQTVPNARQVRIKGAGHLAAVTHSSQVAEEVRRFLEPTDSSDRVQRANSSELP